MHFFSTPKLFCIQFFPNVFWKAVASKAELREKDMLRNLRAIEQLTSPFMRENCLDSKLFHFDWCNCHLLIKKKLQFGKYRYLRSDRVYLRESRKAADRHCHAHFHQHLLGSCKQIYNFSEIEPPHPIRECGFFFYLEVCM